jgi:CRP-like cAMP-binding protein
MRIRNKNRPDTSTLRLIGLDAAVTRDQLDQLALHTDVVTIGSGEMLCRAGQHPRQFIVVVDGYLDVIDRSQRARVAGPGTRIGGVELLDGKPHDEAIVARSPCRLVVIFAPALLWAVRSTEPKRRGTPPIIAWLRDGATTPEPIIDPGVRRLTAPQTQ